MCKSHIVSVFLVRLYSLLQQGQPLCVLLAIFTPKSGSLHIINSTFTVTGSNATSFAGSCIALINFKEATVVERIASVRPYLNIRNDALS